MTMKGSQMLLATIELGFWLTLLCVLCLRAQYNACPQGMVTKKEEKKRKRGGREKE